MSNHWLLQIINHQTVHNPFTESMDTEKRAVSQIPIDKITQLQRITQKLQGNVLDNFRKYSLWLLNFVHFQHILVVSTHVMHVHNWFLKRVDLFFFAFFLLIFQVVIVTMKKQLLAVILYCFENMKGHFWHKKCEPTSYCVHTKLGCSLYNSTSGGCTRFVQYLQLL